MIPIIEALEKNGRWVPIMLALAVLNLFFVANHLNSTRPPVEMQNNTGIQNQTGVEAHYAFIPANSSHVGLVVSVDKGKYRSPQITRNGEEMDMNGPYDSFDEATNAAVKDIKFPGAQKDRSSDYDVQELERRNKILRAATTDDVVDKFCTEKGFPNGYADVDMDEDYVVVCFEFAGNSHTSTRYGMFDEFGEWVIGGGKR